VRVGERLISDPRIGVPVKAMRCPRCGREGRLEEYEVNGRRYLRVVHGSYPKRERCYLGPADSYSHAAPLLQLRLRSLADVDYAEVVQDAVESLLAQAELRGYGEEAGEWLARVRRMRQVLEEELERAKAVEARLEKLAGAQGE